ncbi:DEAD/DEAH box helicase [Leifsonia sp. PS1209]|uniref:DEAD/DEAH box helicase n=1 Tax=Leifsonia sp. PS1209 TaxID=2724914 RepID=UPI001442C4C8|nr:DEAD/DEAH box helicase [Leifsonia sp. PS1209]QIZ99425.1 DEAD/DEAH box helicase [Leifsonia sp. PS1209]
MTRSLEDAVFASDAFRATLDSCRLLTLRNEFQDVQWSSDQETIDWGFALLAASALTSTSSERAQAAVLRVVIACLLSETAEPEHKSAATVLLERVGNHMTVDLAERRKLVPADAWSAASTSLKLEVVRSRIAYSIRLADREILPVNPFQDRLWSELDHSDWLSVSAPTSAGKSRIVRERFVDFARERDSFTLIYLVPTRALIEEVSRDFRRESPPGTGVFTLPWDPEFDKTNKRILVLTQERLHLIQELHAPLHMNVMFVDEAQSLGGNDRGVLLQRSIERAARENPDLKLVFASPLSSNPGILVEQAPAGVRVASFTSETVTVNQNLIRVEGVRRKPDRRAVKLVSEGVASEVGEIVLPQRATTVPLKLALVAFALAGDTSGNVVYVNGADDAEKVSKALFEQLPLPDHDDDIQNLRDLVQTAVHPKYLLADVLEKRVAFHYGNMPLVIRTEIERLFADGKIKYLVCTSTLLEGVNLPCRSIFMRNPQKGRGRPLSEADFWNLAGRAGRWGKEFQGNVVCIDTDDPELWENLPATRKRFPLSKAVDNGLDDPSGLLDFVRSPRVVSDARSESIFSFLCERRSQSLDIQPLLDRITLESERHEMSTAIDRALEAATFPLEMITRHNGISPSYMERLLESFRAADTEPSELELPLPEEHDSKARFQEVLVLLGATMTNVFGTPQGAEDRRKWQIANLIVNWMRGMPLARLIDQRINSNIPIARAIRDVMSDIETIARFQAPKYLSCYTDLLGVYASERGIHTPVGKTDYAMLLELGVSRASEVVLMSLGLSRTATVALGAYVTRDSWSAQEAITWLAAQNIESFDIPVLIQREIADVVSSAERRRLTAI